MLSKISPKLTSSTRNILLLQNLPSPRRRDLPREWMDKSLKQIQSRKLTGPSPITCGRRLHSPRLEPKLRDDKGRFTTERAQGRADENAVAKAALDLKFKRDQISTEEYLTQSGAIESYLEQQGIPLDLLKEVAAERSDTRLVQSWQETTTEFLRSAGADWPAGGRENVNLKRIGDIIQQQNWVDEPDKVGVLAAAYQHLKQNGMLDKSHIDDERRLRE